MSLYKKMHKTYFTKKISEDEIKSLVLKGYSIEKIALFFKGKNTPSPFWMEHIKKTGKRGEKGRFFLLKNGGCFS